MSDMKQYAQHLSSKGRYGDSELVHVTPDELSLLKNIGAGTINPDTGLYEFYHTAGHAGNEVTFDQKFAAERKAQGAGGSFDFEGKTYNTDYAEEASGSSSSQSQGRGTLTQAQRTENTANSFLGLDRDGDGSMWTKTDEFGTTTNWLGQEMNIVEGVNDEYFFGALDVDGDGSWLTSTTFNDRDSGQPETKQNDSTWGERFTSRITGKSPFSTALNVVGLLAAPVPTLLAAGVGATIDTNNDGSIMDNITDAFNRPLTPDQKKRHEEFVANMNNNDDDDNSNTYSEVQEVVQETEASEVPNDLTDLKFTINGNGELPFLDYEYTADGTNISNSYDGQPKPFRLDFGSNFQASAYTKAEKARNAVMEMVARLPASMQDELKGDISIRMDSSNNMNLYVGDQRSGYIEASYSGDQEGYTNLIGDVESMLAYTNETGDTNFNSGYLGRITSHGKYSEYDVGLLQAELTNLRTELSNATQSNVRAVLGRKIASVETELRRRNGETLDMADSIAGVTDVISQSASEMVSAVS